MLAVIVNHSQTVILAVALTLLVALNWIRLTPKN